MPDQLLPPPPPGIPAPERTVKKWLLRIGVVSAGYLIVMVVLKLTLGAKRGNMLPYASGNLRQLGLALFEFENEYGRYPDNSTVAAVRRNTETRLSLPNHTSNDLFAQLLVTGFARNELVFNAQADTSADNVFNTDATILEHGECLFAYISGRSAAEGSAPLVFGPVIPGTKIFDRNSCGGNAVILRVDNSVISLPIDASGRAIVNGMDFLDPRQPFWKGKAPDVKWPK